MGLRVLHIACVCQFGDAVRDHYVLITFTPLSWIINGPRIVAPTTTALCSSDQKCEG